MFPMNLAAAFNTLFFFMPFFLKLSIIGLATFWSVKCGFKVVDCIAPADKVYLAAFPITLFYLGLAWFILSANN